MDSLHVVNESELLQTLQTGFDSQFSLFDCSSRADIVTEVFNKNHSEKAVKLWANIFNQLPNRCTNVDRSLVRVIKVEPTYLGISGTIFHISLMKLIIDEI